MITKLLHLRYFRLILSQKIELHSLSVIRFWRLEKRKNKLTQNSENRKALPRLQFSAKGRQGQERRRQIPLGFASLSAGTGSSILDDAGSALRLTRPRGVWRGRFGPFSPVRRKL